MDADHVKLDAFNMKAGPKCKICRREGKKLFLKGERCNTQKCAVIKKNYPPGVKKSTRPRRMSEYAYQLREKQKLKRIYNLTERQFKKYYIEALQRRGLTSELMLCLLETRLDNVIYRLGFSSSLPQAREVVNHGHFLVSGKPVNIPSYQVKAGDTITPKKGFLKSTYVAGLKAKLKAHNPPSWLALDLKKMEGKVKKLPSGKELEAGVDLSMIIEFYSR